MPLSRMDVLAILAVVDIAIHGQARPVRASEIAPRHGLPARYLEATLQSLAGSGILSGKREARGYRLARASHLITVDDILRAMRATQAPLENVRSLIGRRVVVPALDDAQMVFSQAFNASPSMTSSVPRRGRHHDRRAFRNLDRREAPHVPGHEGGGPTKPPPPSSKSSTRTATWWCVISARAPASPSLQ
jgi:Rrf2 family transcriptional regulator, iron-sulfur cluster assembly transcription factor